MVGNKMVHGRRWTDFVVVPVLMACVPALAQQPAALAPVPAAPAQGPGLQKAIWEVCH